MDGDTLSIDFHTDAISWSDENPNIVIAMVYLNYSEDETSGGQDVLYLEHQIVNLIQ